MRRDEIPTPALLLDLDRFERNLSRMAAHVRAAGKSIRPHAKTHRCPEIARRQIGAGALGVACAKLGEAEVMAEAGIRGLLCTTPIVPAAKIQRLVNLMRRAPDTMIVVDNAANVAALDVALGAAGVVANVLVDIDVGTRRTGIQPGQLRSSWLGGWWRRARCAYSGSAGLCGALRARHRLAGAARRLARGAGSPDADARAPRTVGASGGDRGGGLHRHVRYR